MKIGLLYNLNQNNEWYEADFDNEYTITTIKNSLEKIEKWNTVELLQVNRNNYDTICNKLQNEKFDIIFNITEWYPWESRESVWPIIMEQLWVLYTWPRPKNLSITLDKSLTKKLLKEKLKDFLSDEFIIYSNEIINNDIINKISNTIWFPLFIKFNSEWSSFWIDQNSIIYNRTLLKEKLFQLRWDYHFADILVEKYIDGEDISVSYVEWLWIFWPVKYEYSNNSKIYDYNMKIFDYNDTVNIVHSYNKNQEILEISKKIVEILHLEWYARIEFRVHNDEIFILEVNNQLCLMPENSFIEAIIKNSKYSYDDIIWHIINQRIKYPIKYYLK